MNGAAISLHAAQMKVDFRLERLPLRAPIQITGYTFVDVPVLTVTLRDGHRSRHADAKRSGRSAWQMAGLSSPKPMVTTYTLGADEPEVMAKQAPAYTNARAFKLKLTGETVDFERVREVRAARPDAWIGIDANQGYNLTALQSPIPIAAD